MAAFQRDPAPDTSWLRAGFRILGQLEVIGDDAAVAGDDRWALCLLRVAGALVALSQLAIAIPDLILHSGAAERAALLYGFNILVGLAFVLLTRTEWMLKRWRPATLAGCICLMASIDAISLFNHESELIFASALFLPLAAGGILPWGTNWQDRLSLVSVLAFGAVAVFGHSPDASAPLHAVGIVTAAALSHFAALVSERRRLAHRRQHRRLSESEAVLLKALDSIADPLAINEVATGRYIKVNDEFLKVTGLAPEQIIGKTYKQIDFLGKRPFGRESRRQFFREGRIRNVEAVFRLPDGRSMPCLVSSVMVELGGRRCALSIARDVTELKAVQRQLEAAKEAALAASRAKSEFLSSMSHEIRTPMNAILGMSDLLAETDLAAEQRRFVEAMTRNGNALLDLIDGILDLAKVESGRLHLEEREFELEELVEQVAETLGVRAYEREVELVTRIAPDVPSALVGDPLRLRQVLINLMGNAIKFTEKGEVELAVEGGAGVRAPEALLFQVRDTGIGIAPDKLETIFQSFTQADSSTTRKYGGSGLGLAIARRLVELMGGRLWVESELGKGSTFYFTARLRPPASPRLAPAAAPGLTQVKIMVADGSARSRSALREMLEHRGAEVIEAESAEEGLRTLAAARDAERPFDLLVVDRTAPVMGGFAMVKALRSDKAYDALGIVMLSRADASAGTGKGGAGHVSVVRKPLRRADLLGAIAKELGAKPALTEEPAAPAPLPKHDAQRRLRILLAEDSQDNRLLISAYLKDLPYELDQAENGDVALRKFEAGHYDLVLMDLQMPVMDGYSTARRIRDRERAQGWRPTPIVALTASALPADVRDSLEAGCTTHLSKPVKKSRLVALIRDMTKEASHLSGRQPVNGLDAPSLDRVARE